jgi:hypothetical protein
MGGLFCAFVLIISSNASAVLVACLRIAYGSLSIRKSKKSLLKKILQLFI